MFTKCIIWTMSRKIHNIYIYLDTWHKLSFFFFMIFVSDFLKSLSVLNNTVQFSFFVCFTFCENLWSRSWILENVQVKWALRVNVNILLHEKQDVSGEKTKSVRVYWRIIRSNNKTRRQLITKCTGSLWRERVTYWPSAHTMHPDWTIFW